ncbi:hypothetical protein VCV18_006692 [Metarhizium anisopliae]
MYAAVLNFERVCVVVVLIVETSNDDVLELMLPDVESCVDRDPRTVLLTVELAFGEVDNKLDPGRVKCTVEMFALGIGVRVMVGSSHESVTLSEVVEIKVLLEVPFAELDCDEDQGLKLLRVSVECVTLLMDELRECVELELEVIPERTLDSVAVGEAELVVFE